MKNVILTLTLALLFTGSAFAEDSVDTKYEHWVATNNLQHAQRELNTLNVYLGYTQGKIDGGSRMQFDFTPMGDLVERRKQLKKEIPDLTAAVKRLEKQREKEIRESASKK